MLCRSAALIGFNDTSILVAPLRCKCWSCDYCLPRLQSRLIAISLAGEPTTLLTLTTNPDTEPDPDRAASLLLAAWQKLSRRMRKRFGREHWAYLGIWEATQRGMPHLHILLRAPWIDQAEISTFMRDEINAPIVDIRHITDNKTVARYVAKYIGKAPTKFEGRTRFARSRNWLDTASQRTYLTTLRDTYGWKLTHQTVEHWLKWIEPHCEIVEDGDGYACTPTTGETPWRVAYNRPPEPRGRSA